MSIFGLPLILFKVGVEDMSDIQFLAIKEFDGKRTDIIQAATNISSSSVETTIASHIANTGKDAYFVNNVQISLTKSAGNSFSTTLRLHINNVLYDSRFKSFMNSGETVIITFPTNNIKFEAGQEFKITAQHDNGGVLREINYISNAILFEEDVGNSPQI